MPFDNAYNRMIAMKLNNTSRKHIALENAMNNNPAAFNEPRSQQEYMSVEHPEIAGGSGNLAATSYDLGYEPKKVGGGVKENQTRRNRLAKAVDGTAKPMPVDVGAVATGRGRRKKAPETMAAQGGDSKALATKGGDFNDVLHTVGNVVETGAKVAKAAASVAPYVLPLIGLGKKRSMGHLSAWNEFVKKTRLETGKNLKDTLKHIKEHNLYKKGQAVVAPVAAPKRRAVKKEAGGSATFPLIKETVDARKGDLNALPRAEGGVPSLRYMSGNTGGKPIPRRRRAAPQN
jgi:hypothetical protein